MSKLTINAEISSRDLASQLSETEIADLIHEKLRYDQIAKWIIDNFDMADVINRYGKETLSHFDEDVLLDHCSEESIRSRAMENSPLSKTLW
jgi:hypothetical protein